MLPRWLACCKSKAQKQSTTAVMPAADPLAPPMTSKAPPDSPLLSLSEDLLKVVLRHVPPDAKPLLLRTCKALRQAVLQTEPHLTLCLNYLKFDRSYREARAVLRREQRIDSLAIIATGPAQAQAQRLVSELSEQAAGDGRPGPAFFRPIQAALGRTSGGEACPNVSALEVVGINRSYPRLLGAFPSITALRLVFYCIGTNTLQRLSRCRAVLI